MAVFLSYHHSRQETVAHLARFFHRFGVETWYAPNDVPPGASWDEAISTAIAHADALVLLFCGQADASPHVKREINLADRARVPIYWLRLERVEPVKLGYFLSSTQWVDWLDERDATLETLVNDLRRLRGMPVITVDFEESSTLSGGLTATDPPADRANNPEVLDTPTPPVGYWPRGIHIFADERSAADCAAHVYFLAARKCPDSSMVLPTGRAATQLFRGMLRVAPDYSPAPFGESHLITDTETFGVWPGHESSRTRHVRETLLDGLEAKGWAPPLDKVHLLTGLITERDPLREAARVLRLWPPAVHAVSIAPNGEVLAYEAGMYTDADGLANEGPGVVELSEHGRGYIDPNQPSRSVLTVGMSSLLDSGTLVVLGFDPKKSTVLRMMLTGPESPGVPATILRRHLNAHLFITSLIADEMGLADRPIETDPREAALCIIEQT